MSIHLLTKWCIIYAGRKPSDAGFLKTGVTNV